MHASLVAQYAVIAVAVLASAWVVMKKQFPHVTRRLCIAVALPLVREGRPGWMRSIGHWIAPAAAKQAAACSGCDNCGPDPGQGGR